MFTKSMLVSKYVLQEKWEVIKSSVDSKFDNLIDFSEDETKNWLVTFINYNGDQLATTTQLWVDAQDIE